MSTARNVAILLFDDVEVLDFAGPFEVFAVSFDAHNVRLFNVYTVSETGETVSARNGLSVNPTYSFATCPKPDIILVPGGQGTRPLINHAATIDWIRRQNEKTELTLSVCTGALLLAKSGILSGLSATTYHTAFDMLAELAPDVTLRPGERWVDNGKVVTSAGVSAGIDMALHIVGRLHGVEQSIRTARHMEYEHWHPVKD